MRIFLCISFCILLMKTGFCEETEPDPERDAENPSTDEQLVANTNNQEIASDSATPVETESCLGLNLNKGKGITITINPDNGNGGQSSSAVGNTYTRWGKTICPRGATLVYDGYAAAGRYNQKGNGANFLCMPKDPQYLSTTNIPWPSCLYPGEYETANKVFSRRVHNHNVPCAVCHVQRSAKIMVPGKVSCPRSWTREYYGYTMAGHMNHWQTVNYECVDYTPDIVPNRVAKRNNNGALFYFLQMECGYGIPCPPYIKRRAITCAICTK